jgi:glycosyltransferase involved in cell wall biosynthesis
VTLKLSLVVLDLSSNAVVRVQPIAKVLQRRFDIDVLGLSFGDGVLEAYRDEFAYKVLPGADFLRGFASLKDLYRCVRGDVVYVFKPQLTTFGVGLLARALDHRPLLLDVDDFETVLLYKNTRVGARLRLRRQYFLEQMLLKDWLNPRALRYQYIMEKFVHCADQITVASRFLQNRYGGIRLPHAVDVDFFDPARYDGQQLRDELGIGRDQRVILFAGTPRPHKGLDLLAEAVSRLAAEYCLLLMIVGNFKGDPLVSRLEDRYKGLLLSIESQPHQRMPLFLAAADFVALPQQDNWIARAQVPVKLSEAMAMSKPIVASAVSDMPEMLDDCGLVFEAGDVDTLTEQIRRLCQDAGLAEELGRKAREKCLREYSWDALEAILVQQVLTQWV